MKKFALLLSSFVFALMFSQCRKLVMPDFGSQKQLITFTTEEETGRGDFWQQGGEIKFQWTLGSESGTGDKLHVYASSDGTFDEGHSEYCGCIEIDRLITTENGSSIAAFKGVILMSSDLRSKMKEGGVSKVRFIHYGKNVNVTENGDNECEAYVSFAEQYGRLTDDISSPAEKSVSSMAITIADMDYKANGKYEGGAMKPLFSIFRFSFEKFSTATVKLAKNVKTEITVSKNGKVEYSNTDDKKMILNNVTSDPYYAVLVPERVYGDGEDVEKTKCVFRSFGEMAVETFEIEPGVFYSSSTEVGGSIIVDAVEIEMLSGAFSVDSEKQVCFSKGNLQYLPCGLPADTGVDYVNMFRFADNQWDFLGDGESYGVSLEGYTNYNSTERGAARDLFGWGTACLEGSSVPWNITENDGEFGPASGNLNDGEAYGTNYEEYDWGHLMAPANIWRTLSICEIEYVFQGRDRKPEYNSQNGEMLGGYGILTLDDGEQRFGVFLLPDDYYFADDGRPSQTTKEGWAYTRDEVDAYKIAFLPVGGYRIGGSVKSIGTGGHYWTSTVADGGKAKFIDYNSSQQINFKKGFERSRGVSVRLVTDIEY